MVYEKHLTNRPNPTRESSTALRGSVRVRAVRL